MQQRELEGLKIMYCHVSWFENIESIEMHSNLMYFTLSYSQNANLCFASVNILIGLETWHPFSEMRP